MKTPVRLAVFSLGLAASLVGCRSAQDSPSPAPSGDHFVITYPGVASVTLYGESREVPLARKELAGSDGVWVRRDGNDYLITDPVLVEKARGICRAYPDAADLGKAQRRISALLDEALSGGKARRAS